MGTRVQCNGGYSRIKRRHEERQSKIVFTTLAFTMKTTAVVIIEKLIEVIFGLFQRSFKATSLELVALEIPGLAMVSRKRTLDHQDPLEQ